MRIAMLIFISLFFSTVVTAATWDVSSIEHGGDGGFGFSGLHDASGSNPASGSEFTQIISASGTYDDVTGAANFIFTILGGSTFNLMGNLLFNNAGWLDNNSTLSYSGLNIPGIAATGVFGYKQGDVCCSGSADPNSFIETSVGLNYLTLWGADGFNISDGTYSGSTVGMDFRLALTPDAIPVAVVPIPAAILLFTPAIFGLLGMGRRKKISNAVA